MRKHGTNRPSIAAILAISALLVTSLVGSAFAGSSGSQSQSGSAAWMVDIYSYPCSGGTTISTSDNYISGGAYVWLKSTRPGFGTLTFELLDKGGKVVYSGTLTENGYGTCGSVYRLFDLSNNSDPGTGSWTIKVYEDGKAFGNDSARFD